MVGAYSLYSVHPPLLTPHQLPYHRHQTVGFFFFLPFFPFKEETEPVKKKKDKKQLSFQELEVLFLFLLSSEIWNLFWFLQLDGTIIAPTNAKYWGSGLLQWLEFTKLVGITVKGSGTIDGNGAVWWKDAPYGDPIDDELKLIVPLKNSSTAVGRSPPLPVMNSSFFPSTFSY